MKIIKLVFLSLLICLSVATVKAETNTTKDCISQSEMKTIAGHFTQFSNLANSEFCNDDSKTWHLLSSLMFMRKTQFSPNMPASQDDLFTGRFANNWYEYFIGRINELEIVNDCPKGVIAYVYMFGNTMYTCPTALTNSFSSLDRASVMMHEARHIDGFPHMTCSKGARKGLQGACDEKIADGGSYAVTVETYAQLAKYAEGIHPALKAYAKSSSVIYADEAFENPVRINRDEKLLLFDKNAGFHSLNVGTGELKKLGSAVAAGKIVKRGQHMILFPLDKTLKAQYVFSKDEGTIEQSPTDFITEYNNQSPEQKAQLVDLHIGAQWSARIYKDKVSFTCDPRSTAVRDIALPTESLAVSLIYPDGYSREKYVALVASSNGTIYEVGCLNKQATLKVSQTRLDQNYVRIHKANNQTFGLNSEGKLFKIEGSRSTPVVTNLDGSILEIVPVQSFEFFEQ
jgi:hypothetical protein